MASAQELPQAPRLSGYDVVLVNSSAGKDSQAMLDYLVELAARESVEDRLVVVHADLGRVEWAGTRELAEAQARHYGVRFEVVHRRQGDLLEHAEKLGWWPRPGSRWCTSDHKRDQVSRLLTRLAAEYRRRRTPRARKHVRILQTLGMRAEESAERAKLAPFRREKRASNSLRHVDMWLPIHSWTADEVWDRIRASGVPHHPAYDLGMPRLSCCFCIYAPRDALILAGQHNPELLDEYVRVEEAIGHDFKHHLPIASIRDAVRRGEQPARSLQSWCM